MRAPSLVNVERARELVGEMFAAGIAAVDPVSATSRAVSFDGTSLHVNGRSFDTTKGRVIAVAIGKAALEMSHGLTTALGDRLDTGFVLTKEGVRTRHPLPGFQVFHAAHPVPDERGAEATHHILAALSDLSPDDIVVALLSGGGSALLEAPRPPLQLSDIQHTTALLLSAGASIQDLNAVRSELSLVKGGGMRRAIGDATCISLILSDVLGNDPSVIASGPTMARQRNPGHALELLNAYRVHDRVPKAVVGLLEGDPDTEPHSSACETSGTDGVWRIVGDNDQFLDAIHAQAVASGYRSAIVWRQREGEARDLGRKFAGECASISEGIDVIIGGGEATVTVRGDGVGGRNTEFALAAAMELDRRDLPWVIASLASDGDDGSNDRAAGGIVDRGLIARANEIGLNAAIALDRNDSGTYLREAGALFHTSPTGTNVNDAYIGVRIRRN